MGKANFTISEPLKTETLSKSDGIVVLEKELDNILQDYKKSLSKILDDRRYVKIAVAGRMNHGKSSLLNSLICEDIFAVKDIRETIKNSRYEWFDDVLVVDTPGLDAEEDDDKIANAAYESSDLILFVHNYGVGDFHKGELDALKRISSFHQGKSDSIILVLTGKDAVFDESDRNTIKSKIKKDIENYCQIKGLKIFEVSNTTYKNAIINNKSKLTEYSGISQLEEYLKKIITSLRANRTDKDIIKIKNINNVAIDQFNKILEQKGSVIYFV